jgi:hypothetical protein
MESDSGRPWQIVIPLHPSGGKMRDDSELRYTLRALATHFTEPYEVTIVGQRLPAWLGGVRLLQGGGLKAALGVAAKAYPEGFFWFYDDCCLLRDTTGEEMKVTPFRRHWVRPNTKWGGQLHAIKARLEKEGRPVMDYSGPHGPYWFDGAMVDEGFEDWPGMKMKFPWESWILNKRAWPGREGVVCQYYAPPGAVEPGDAWILHYNDKGNSPELRAWLEQRFAVAERFEETRDQRPETRDQSPDKRRDGPGVLEVHTLRYGDADWLLKCAPTLDAWCARHGLPLKVWGNEFPQYPCAKFGELDMLRAFLAGPSTHFLYVDADVYVAPFAPVPALTQGFVAARDEPHRNWRAGWQRWCARVMRVAPDRDYVYRNAGVWLCDRAAAQLLLDEARPPWRVAVQEQHQWNVWVMRAVARGIKLEDLDGRWNRYHKQMSEPAWFYHFNCKDKKIPETRDQRPDWLTARARDGRESNEMTE